MKSLFILYIFLIYIDSLHPLECWKTFASRNRAQRTSDWSPQGNPIIIILLDPFHRENLKSSEIPSVRLLFSVSDHLPTLTLLNFATTDLTVKRQVTYSRSGDSDMPWKMKASLSSIMVLTRVLCEEKISKAVLARRSCLTSITTVTSVSQLLLPMVFYVYWDTWEKKLVRWFSRCLSAVLIMQSKRKRKL